MILQREISEKATEWNIAATTVDKDYVLGHFLSCFFHFEDHKNRFVFKGGTCLRKCYFSNYRFSEDLDFTLKDANFLVDENLIHNITQACTLHSGIPFYLEKFETKQFQNEDKGYHCVIAFWGANHSRNKAPVPIERWTTKIELDISFDEELLFPINYKAINHPYSDKNILSNNPIPIYSLEEILTEKVRSFYQRSYKAPRDFYDVWYLLQQYKFSDWDTISEVFRKKCAVKNKTVDIEMFNNTKLFQTVSKSWHQSIAHHIPAHQLPEFEEVWHFLQQNLFINFLKP
ncbi:MAG: nucleotidyl transferase AbiEii/AbiGii toxin family protein [Moheibacter sp.]